MVDAFFRPMSTRCVRRKHGISADLLLKAVGVETVACPPTLEGGRIGRRMQQRRQSNGRPVNCPFKLLQHVQHSRGLDCPISRLKDSGAGRFLHGPIFLCAMALWGGRLGDLVVSLCARLQSSKRLSFRYVRTAKLEISCGSMSRREAFSENTVCCLASAQTPLPDELCLSLLALSQGSGQLGQ